MFNRIRTYQNLKRTEREAIENLKKLHAYVMHYAPLLTADDLAQKRAKLRRLLSDYNAAHAARVNFSIF